MLTFTLLSLQTRTCMWNVVLKMRYLNIVPYIHCGTIHTDGYLHVHVEGTTSMWQYAHVLMFEYMYIVATCGL